MKVVDDDTWIDGLTMFFGAPEGDAELVHADMSSAAPTRNVAPRTNAPQPSRHPRQFAPNPAHIMPALARCCEKYMSDKDGKHSGPLQVEAAILTEGALRLPVVFSA